MKSGRSDVEPSTLDQGSLVNVFSSSATIFLTSLDSYK